MKIVKTENVDIKPFIDFSWMMPSAPDVSILSPDGSTLSPQDGNGFTAGLLGRFNYGDDVVHAIRIIGEFRSFSATYLPGYFDTFYEIQKYVSSLNYGRYATLQQSLPPTKYKDIFIDRAGLSRKMGFSRRKSQR